MYLHLKMWTDSACVCVYHVCMVSKKKIRYTEIEIFDKSSPFPSRSLSLFIVTN